MTTAQIAQPPITTDMPAAAQRLRKHAPEYIARILDSPEILPGVHADELRPEQIKVMGGGVDAAAYLVTTPSVRVIVKISNKSLDPEAEALQAWRIRHVRVPNVLASGMVPGTANSREPMWYLAQQALVNEAGRVVETAAEFLVRKPAKAHAIGELMGHELAKLHQAQAERSYGEYGSGSGGAKPYASWNAYCNGFIDVQTDHLCALGVSDQQIAHIKNYIESCAFARPGRYIHGDFSIRNAAVKSYDPLKIVLFDPNPMVGDPSWDLAVPFNNYEFQKRRLKMRDNQRELYVRDQQFLSGIKKGYTRVIHADNLMVAQLLQALLQTQFKEKSRRKNADEALDYRVRKAFVLELAASLASKGARV